MSLSENSVSIVSIASNDKVADWLKNVETKNALTQWDLLDSLAIERFSIANETMLTENDFQQVLCKLLNANEFCQRLQLSALKNNDNIVFEKLETTVNNLNFFDRLDAVAPNGHIRGCYEEVFDGVSVGDELRELLVNNSSLHSSLFNDDERKQFIFHLLRLFAIGGGLVQPDVVIDRYLEMAKSLYKALLTIYRENKSKEVKISSRVYHVKNSNQLMAKGTEFSQLYILVDPLLRQITAIKSEHKPFW